VVSFRAQFPVRALLVTLMLAVSCLASALFESNSLQQLAIERYGEEAGRSVKTWQELLQNLKDQPIDKQLSGVNDFFNRRIAFAEDMDIWGVPDYWATPFETMAKRRGDCEDFSIAKYVSLRLLGISDDKLRLIYVSARLGGAMGQLSQAHMVLGYYPEPEAEPLILDNLLSEIRPASQRRDLQPVFSFNSAGLWVSGAGSTATDSSMRLSRWRELLARMHAEGLTIKP
jgi:predicted transglutaminase-like cysteine proteinase